jgi:hypothetical protein
LPDLAALMAQDGGVRRDGMVSLTQAGPLPSGLVRVAEKVVAAFFGQDPDPLQVVPDLVNGTTLDGLTFKLSAVRPALWMTVKSQESP